MMMTLVKVKVWRIVWRDGSSDVYFVEADAHHDYCMAQSDCVLTEEIRTAIKAE